jgi:tetratricopeptide (TPR) repeat protein
MEIDVYQHCPCHSGKKIKFCCGKNVVSELNEIVAKNRADQSVAALAQLERVIAKHGPLNCLLTIQTHILISTGDLEKARESNALYLQHNPNHPIGLQHEALIALAEGDTGAAIDRLQDAMDAITGNEIPITFANAFRLVGLGLLSQGHLLGARAHFQFAQILKGQPDQDLQRLLFETFRIPDASLLLKYDYRIPQPPEGKEWTRKFVNVIKAMDRGQFRKALTFLKRIDADFPDEPVVLYSIAVLNGILVNMDELAESWRRYSRVAGISQWDAVEAEAMAQLFTVDPITAELDIVRITFEISHLEDFFKIADSHPRFAALPPLEEDPFEEGPAPRYCFYFLDRDKVATPEELTLETVSSVAGEILAYGKQTDRPARFEWITTRNDRFQEFKRFIQNTFADVIRGEPSERLLGSTTAIADALTWNWHLPKGVTRKQHADLIDQQRRRTLHEGWANLPFTVLENKTPLEAAKDEKYAIPLSALVLHLEQSNDAQTSEHSAATELRKILGIPMLPVIDPAVELDRPVSPVRQQYLQMDKLTDEQLLNLHAEAMAVGNFPVMRKLVPEILSRPNLDEKIPRDVSLSIMAHLSESDEEALEHLQQAKNVAVERGRPIGVYLVQELELRMERGLTEKLAGLLQRIQIHHLGEPNVEQSLVRVLNRFGLLEREAAAPGFEPHEIDEPANESAGGIWSPAQATAEAPPEEATKPSEGSKLWLPGRD